MICCLYFISLRWAQVFTEASTLEGRVSSHQCHLDSLVHLLCVCVCVCVCVSMSVHVPLYMCVYVSAYIHECTFGMMCV